MENEKLHQAIFGSAVSWAATLLATLKDNAAVLAALLAAVASFFTILAAYETWQVKRLEKRKLKRELGE